MPAIRFVITGPLVGYRRPTDKGSGYKRYTEFKNRVLMEAMDVGWRERATSLIDKPPRLSVMVRWKEKPHSDWSNIYKAIEDALFSQDRYVKPGSFQGKEWNCGVEEAVVIVET